MVSWEAGVVHVVLSSQIYVNDDIRLQPRIPCCESHEDPCVNLMGMIANCGTGRQDDVSVAVDVPAEARSQIRTPVNDMSHRPDADEGAEWDLGENSGSCAMVCHCWTLHCTTNYCQSIVLT